MQDYNKVITELLAEMPSIISISFISSDGLVLATNTNSNVQPDKLAALSAATVGLAKKSAEELHLGQLKEMQVQGSRSNHMIYSVDDKRVLSIICPAEINVGMLSILVRKKMAEFLS